MGGILFSRGRSSVVRRPSSPPQVTRLRSYLSAFLYLGFVGGLGVLVWQALVQPTPARLGISTADAAPPGLEVRETSVIGWGRGPERGVKLFKLTASRITTTTDQRLTTFVGITDAVLFRDDRPHVTLQA